VLNGNHPDSPTTDNLPDDLAYAVYTNKNKAAINNGIFAEHIWQTHLTNPNVTPPMHTLVICLDDLTWSSNKKAFGAMARHAMWSGCAECDIKMAGERGKYVDAFLKLYTHVPLMYTEMMTWLMGLLMEPCAIWRKLCYMPVSQKAISK